MSQEEIIIREARIEDSSDIAAILRALDWSEQIHDESPAQTQAHIAERIEQCLRERNHTILVAERKPDLTVDKAAPLSTPTSRSGTVIGYIAAHWFFHLLRGSDGYVSELFLHPNETGHGIGSHLLDAIYTYARERGCIQLILMNRRIRESYSRQFYAKHGWKEQPDAAFFSITIPPISSSETHNKQLQVIA